MAIPPLILRIYADSSGVKAGVASAKRSVGGMTGFMKQNAALIGVALASAAVTFGVKSVKAFNESESAIAQTNAVLKSTKGIAGVTSAEVTKLATSMQKLTTFSDEEVRSAENLLLTFTNISDDIFPDTTKAVLDMSQALGQDLKSSSIQLGKALNDPILGLTSLSRVGVKFTQETRDQIKALVENGKTLQAQKIILRELATEFGGSAKKAAGTFGGRMKQLGNQVNDVMEEFGKLITTIGPILLPVIEFAIKALRKMIANLTIMVGAVKTAVLWIGDKFVAAWKAIRGPVLAVVHAITAAVGALGAAINGVVDAIKWLIQHESNIPTANSVTGAAAVGKGGFGVKAVGGSVTAGGAYIVGEVGPELFVPRQSGTVVPNNQLDGGGTIVHVYVGEHEVEDIVVRAQRRAQMKRSGV